MEKLMEILKGIRPEVDFAAEKKLIDDGILDSFDLVSLVGELNDEFDIEIEFDDMEAENFNSAEAMMQMINRLMEED